MNNKGFTVIELITTFAIVSAISLLLFNLVLSIKNTYNNTKLKTELIINQSNLVNLINKETLNNDIVSIDFCNDSIENSIKCYEIEYSNQKTKKLIIGKKIIQFGNFTYKLDNNVYIDEDNVTITNDVDNDIVIGNENSILNIRIPILCNQYPKEDFGLNYIYTYSSGSLNFNIE